MRHGLATVFLFYTFDIFFMSQFIQSFLAISMNVWKREISPSRLGFEAMLGSKTGGLAAFLGGKPI